MIIRTLLLLLSLLPSVAWADDNPYHDKMDTCFLRQLKDGVWPNTLVSWAKMVAACPDVVNQVFAYCRMHTPAPADGACVADVLLVAMIDIDIAIDPDTLRLDPKTTDPVH
jgi:hypothetical protein